MFIGGELRGLGSHELVWAVDECRPELEEEFEKTDCFKDILATCAELDDSASLNRYHILMYNLGGLNVLKVMVT